MGYGYSDIFNYNSEEKDVTNVPEVVNNDLHKVLRSEKNFVIFLLMCFNKNLLNTLISCFKKIKWCGQEVRHVPYNNSI